MATQVGPSVISPAADLTSDSSVQMHNLGELVHTTDGRIYRYVKAGASDLVPGKLQQAAAQASGLQNLSVAAAAIGATSITTTSTVTLTANQLAGGYVCVTVTPGQGQLLKIKSHPAASAAVVTLTLEDPVVVALTTSSKIDLQVNPYSGVIINPATASSSPVGVCTYKITAAQFGWLQVAGPCNVLADGAVTVGTNLAGSNAVAGAVEPHTGVQALVGTALTDISDTEYGAVLLALH